MNRLYSFMRQLEPKNNVLILMYHGFTDKKQFEGIENHHGKHLHIDKFKEQISYLKEHYQIISLDELINYYTTGDKIPPRSVVITMDDGYRSNYSLAFEVLKEFDAPATIFVSTDFIDKKDCLWVDRVEYALNQTQQIKLSLQCREEKIEASLSDLGGKKRADQSIKSKLKRKSLDEREAILQKLEDQLEVKLSFQKNLKEMYAPLDWSEITKMQDSRLIAIGNHTCSHMILTSCNDVEKRDELKHSKMRIEEQLKKPCRLFSYPNGEIGDFNKDTKKILQELGFSCGLTTVIGSNNSSADVYELKRLNLHNEGDLSGFIRTLSEFWRFLRKVKNAGHFGA